MMIDAGAGAGSGGEIDRIGERWRASPLADVRASGVLLAADLALARGDTAAAIAGARAAVTDHASWLAHAVLGRALLAAGHRDDGLGELQWCHDHRGAGATVTASSLWLVADADRELAAARAAGAGSSL